MVISVSIVKSTNYLANIMKKIFTLMLLFVTIFSFAINTKVARIIDGDTFETETGEIV